MATKKVKLERACELPSEWDGLAAQNGNIYLNRKFLEFIERTEADYTPAYYLFYDGDKLDSCFIAYKRRGYNVAMFTPISFRISVTLIYLPMSVTASGIILGKLRDEVFDEIRRIRGYKMILNLNDENAPGYATGLTCSKCILDLSFSSFDDYLLHLRSHYRNHAKKVFKRAQDISIRYIDNRTEFTDEMYEMYLSIQRKSRIKIETLSANYFRGDMFKMFVAELDGHVVGFVQLLENGSELIFEFVGVDQEYNEKYPVYHRMLYEIIRYGIDGGFKTIDFGQTADDTKLKLGCHYEELWAALHHSSPIINGFCKLIAPFIEFKPLKTEFRVFREDEE
ncbi:MAG: GNAT family N-acetyltransferase [Clostridia bacterium]|nr:GNAT family N-acetyltransferase [Clostridia bacterium]